MDSKSKWNKADSSPVSLDRCCVVATDDRCPYRCLCARIRSMDSHRLGGYTIVGRRSGQIPKIVERSYAATNGGSTSTSKGHCGDRRLLMEAQLVFAA